MKFLDSQSNPPNDTITIRYSLIVRNATNLPIKDVNISINGPVLHTASQYCRKIQSGRPYSLLKDNFGNQTLTFQWAVFPPLSTKIVNVQSDIQRWTEPQEDKTSPASQFLKSEPFIESDDSMIRKQAEKLKARTKLQTAENIYHWVADHVIYKGYVSRNRGAAYALKHGKGDCTEYAFLFVALCRANDIPARPLAGFICPQSMVVDFGDYHNWAEFFLNGRWHVADPQNKMFMKNARHYIALQNVRPSEGLNGFLIDSINGRGLEVKIKPKQKGEAS